MEPIAFPYRGGPPPLWPHGKKVVTLCTSIVEYTKKLPGENITPKDTNSIAEKGDATLTSGLLGMGKIMSSWRPNHSEKFEVGCSLTDDALADPLYTLKMEA